MEVSSFELAGQARRLSASQLSLIRLGLVRFALCTSTWSHVSRSERRKQKGTSIGCPIDWVQVSPSGIMVSRAGSVLGRVVMSDVVV